MKILLRLLSQVGGLGVFVPSVVGDAGVFVAGTQQVQGSLTVLIEHQMAFLKSVTQGYARGLFHYVK